MKIAQIKQEMHRKEEREISTYFKPTIYSSPKLNKTVFERLRDDGQKRSEHKPSGSNYFSICVPFSPNA